MAASTGSSFKFKILSLLALVRLNVVLSHEFSQTVALSAISESLSLAQPELISHFHRPSIDSAIAPHVFSTVSEEPGESPFSTRSNDTTIEEEEEEYLSSVIGVADESIDRPVITEQSSSRRRHNSSGSDARECRDGLAFQSSSETEIPSDGILFSNPNTKLYRATYCIRKPSLFDLTGCLRWFNFHFSIPEFQIFHEAGVPMRSLRKLHMAFFPNRRPSVTEHIAFAFAGQQISRGWESGVTGQRLNYKLGWSLTDWIAKDTVDIHRGLLYKIRLQGHMPASRLFGALVFDAKYRYYDSDWKRESQFDGFYHLIQSRMGPNMKTVYLFGHSRGGCLAARLGARLSKEYPNLRIILHLFDPVCRPREIGGSDTIHHRNPHPDAGRFWKTNTVDIEKMFPNKKCLSIRSFLCGDPVILARAFSHVGFTGSTALSNELADERGREFYTQSWHSENHRYINSHHHEIATQHFHDSVNNFPPECSH